MAKDNIRTTDMPASLYLFDFDGTLTNRDSLLCLFSFYGGRARMLWEFLKRSPQLVLMKLRLYSNHKLKQQIFASYFRGMPLDDFNRLCRRFAEAHMNILRRQGVATIRQALASGAAVAVVSASIDNWVRPFLQLAFTDSADTGAKSVEVLGTQVEVVNGCLTGRFSTSNCYGPEKVRRVREAFPGLDKCRIVAFGDSRGDREMLALADERHYKPFRN